MTASSSHTVLCWFPLLSYANEFRFQHYIGSYIIFCLVFSSVIHLLLLLYYTHRSERWGTRIEQVMALRPPCSSFSSDSPHRFFCFFRVMFLLSITSIRHGRFFSSPQSFDRPVFFRGGWPPIHRVRRYSAYGGIIKTTTTECPLILYPYNKTKNSNSFALEIQK